MNYKKLTKSLIAQLREARYQLENYDASLQRQSDISYETERRLTNKLNLLREEQAREKEEQEYQEWQRKDTLKDLERAKEWGNKYDEERCMERLRRL